MNHQWWRTARRPRRSSTPDTVAPLVGAMLDTDPQLCRRTARGPLDAQLPGAPCDDDRRAGRVRRAARARAGLPCQPEGPPRRRRHRRAAAARGARPLPPGRRHRRRRRRRALGATRRVGAPSSDLEIADLPRVPRASSWPRSAAARGRAGPSAAPQLTGDHGALVEVGGVVGVRRPRARSTAHPRRRLPRPVRRVGRRPSRARAPRCTVRHRPVHWSDRGRCAPATSTCSTT